MQLGNYATSASMVMEPAGFIQEIPADWKEDNVIPAYKGMRETLGNYRPVIQASVPGKITENLVLGATDRTLEDKAIIRHR